MSRDGGPDITRLGVAFYVAMGGAAVAWGLWRGLWRGWWAFEDPADVAVGAAVGIAAGVLGVLISRWMERQIDDVRELSERFSMVLRTLSRRDAVLLAALSAVGEEALFRGCVQEELGLLPAALLFALVHSGRDRVWLWWTASAFGAGVVLGGLYELQGGLLAPTLMHFVINGVNIAVLARRGAEEQGEELVSLLDH